MDSHRTLVKALGAACLVMLMVPALALATDVQPTIATDPLTGQPTTRNIACAAIDPSYRELKVEPVSSGTRTSADGLLTVTLTAGGQLFDWTASAGSVDAVLVKGGNYTNQYVYDPESTGDTGLHAPDQDGDNDGNFAGLSHVSLCYDLDVDISGTKYEDANADGQTTGDAGWDGVTIKLDPGTPADDSDDLTDVTSGGGHYSFDDLTPGIAYRVYEVTPSGSTCSLPAQSCQRQWTAEEAVGGATLTQDFANWRPVDITGTKYRDIDEDSETSIPDGAAAWAGVTIWLDPGTPDDASDDSSDVTDENGDYAFSNLTPGVDYRVYEEEPAGSVCTYPSNEGCDATFAGESGGDYSQNFANFTPNPGITIDKTVHPDDVLVHVGDELDYTIAVTNTGNTELDVELTDPGCAFGEQDLTFTLAPGASATRTCTASAPDAASYTNKACLSASDDHGNTLSGEAYCDEVKTDIIKPAIAVTKTVDEETVHAGDLLTYTIVVSNTGNTALDVSMTDLEQNTDVAGCTFPEGTSMTFDLAVGASEEFECTKEAPDQASYVNEVCVVGVDELGGDKGTVGDDPKVCAEAETDIIEPAIDVTKSVDKASARAGETLTYTIVVSNPSDTDLVTVDMTDLEKGTAAAGCTFPDGTSMTFELAAGASEQFSCTKAMPDQDAYVNEVCVSGEDMLGGPKGSVGPECAEAQTTIVRDPAPDPPAQVVEPTVEEPPGQIVLGERIIPGVARLLGPSGCAGKPFRVRVAGTRVARVVFTLDGKRLQTLRRPNFRGQFAVRINPSKLRVGVHRLRATVTFESASRTRTRTMRLSFQRCARRLQAPRFTG